VLNPRTRDDGALESRGALAALVGTRRHRRVPEFQRL
jgi:hypothetical protein